MPELKFFTWNLGGEQSAHHLALQHLSALGAHTPWIACLQELPAECEIAWARKKHSPPEGTVVVKDADLVSTGKGRETMPSGMALVFSPLLTLVSVYADRHLKFVDARFSLSAPTKTFRVIGLHAKSAVDMQKAEDKGGSRALLRHAINARPIPADHTVILGDWNSDCEAREITSWHCFYALHPRARPLLGDSRQNRCGCAHPPFFVVMPSNNSSLGTYAFGDSGESSSPTIDFIAVDEGTRQLMRAEILTKVAASSVASPDGAPNVSDHLPVEGTLTF
ncbi:MAG: hypothetical protein U0325_25215 [Polyangiales bacterium]